MHSWASYPGVARPHVSGRRNGRRVGPPVELKWAHQPTNLSHPTSSSSAAAPRERQKQKQKQRRGKKKEIVNFLKRHAKSSHEDVQRDKNVTTPTQTPTPTPAPATPLSLEVELDEAPAATMQDGVTVVSCDGLYEHVLNVDLLCLCPVTRCMFTSGPFAEALRGRVLFQTIPGAALKECVRFLYALKTNTLNQHSIAGYKARLTDLLRAAHFLQLLPLLHKTAAALAEQSEAYMEELMVLPRALLCVVLKYCNAGHLHLVSLRLPPSPFPSSRPRGSSRQHPKPYSCPIDIDGLWLAMQERNTKQGRIPAVSPPSSPPSSSANPVSAKRQCVQVFLERLAAKYKPSSQSGVNVATIQSTFRRMAHVVDSHVDNKHASRVLWWCAVLGAQVDAFRIENGLIGCRFLGQLVHELQHVRVLDVHGVGYGVDAGLAVVKNVRNLHALSVLNLSNTFMSIDGLRALAGAMQAKQHASAQASMNIPSSSSSFSSSAQPRGKRATAPRAVSRASKAQGRLKHAAQGPTYMFGSLTPRGVSSAASEAPSSLRRTVLSARRSSKGPTSGPGNTKIDLSARQLGSLSVVMHKQALLSDTKSSGQPRRQQQQQGRPGLSLILANNPLGDVCITALSDSMLSGASSLDNPPCHVRSLDVSCNRVGYKGAVLLAGLISAPRNNTGYANELQVLNASRTELQDLGVRRIAAAMCENSSVVELDVSFCIPLQYDNSSACTAGSSLGKMIAVNTTLHTLRLRGNHFPPQECVSLLRGLHSAAATSALRKLDLSYVPLQGNNVAPAVTLALKQIVSVHSRLAELSLNHCQLTGECLSALASGLTHNSSLHTLHAAGNECTHQAMEHFGDLLAGDTALRVLDLSASADERAHRMRSEGCMDFSRKLVQNSTLEFLDLSNHGVRNEGFSLLMSAMMSETSRLTRLVLQNNHIDARGMMNCAGLLSKLKMMIKVNGVPHHSYQGAQCLLMRGALLDLRGNTLGEQEYKAFEHVIPRSIVATADMAADPESLDALARRAKPRKMSNNGSSNGSSHTQRIASLASLSLSSPSTDTSKLLQHHELHIAIVVTSTK